MTLWLMPFEERAADDSHLIGAEKVHQSGDDQPQYRVSVERFKDELRELSGNRVTVINTTRDPYRQQLIAPHPDYPHQTMEMIASQRATLTALARIAKAENLRLSILFVSWGTALPELLNPPPDIAPDVAELGSTWAEALAARPDGPTRLAHPQPHEMLPPTSPKVETGSVSRQPPLNWRYGRETNKPITLKLSFDVRLLFYWRKRGPKTQALGKPSSNDNMKILDLAADDWEAMLRQLEDYLTTVPDKSYPMVFPVKTDFDLLHNHLMLAASGGGRFLNYERAVFDSADAMRVPQLLARTVQLSDPIAANRARRPVTPRIVSFPIIASREAQRRFRTKDYVAILTNTSLIKRWHRGFQSRKDGESFWEGVSEDEFWQYVGVAIPPGKSFLGGTDIAVFEKGGQSRRAGFEFAKRLVTDPEIMAIKSRQGYFSAQRFAAPAGGKLDARLLPLQEELGIPDRSRVDRPGWQDYVDCVTLLLNDADNPNPQRLVEHEPHPQFGTEVESPDVLYAMQRVWLAMAEGDLVGLDEKTRDAVEVINGRIHEPTRFWNDVSDYWTWLLAVCLGVLGLVVALAFKFKQSSDRLQLSNVAIQTLRHRNYAILEHAGSYFADSHRMSQQAVAELAGQLAQLRDWELELEEDARQELESRKPGTWFPLFGWRRRSGGHRGCQRIGDICCRAWKMAALQYQFTRKNSPPEIVWHASLEEFQLARFPHQLTLFLVDFFYNAASYAHSGRFSVSFRGRAFIIRCPLEFGDNPTRELQEGSAGSGKAAESSPFTTISDLCHAAYGVRPRCVKEDDNRNTSERGSAGPVYSIVTIRLPVVRISTH